MDLKSFFSIPRDRPELLIAQAKAYSQQIPVLYVVLLTNACVLAYAHYKLAPAWITWGGLCSMSSVCIFRTAVWARHRHQTIDVQRADALLSRTIQLCLPLGLGFTIWALALFPYGDIFAKAHVTFFIAITVVACIFCLMHLRAAALIVVAAVLPTTIVFLWATGLTVYRPILINMLVVGAALIAVTLKHYNEFADLVQSRIENDRLANLDGLTGLPNRRRFFQELEAQVDAAKLKEGSIAVGVIDLDGFKPVNDAFGHATGDRLLIEVGRRLQEIESNTLFIARLGGDEFGLIIDHHVSSPQLQLIGSLIVERLSTPFYLPGVVAHIGASVGFCTYPEGGEDAQTLFERADYALYHAKQNVKGAAVVFDDSHENEIRALGQIEQELRKADFDRELYVHFQPIYDIDLSKTVGFEALARWKSPTLGDVPPSVFIRAAERSGFISEVTQHLVERATKAALAWPMDLRLAINLSARDIASMDSVHRLMRIVEASPLASHRIDFEITETAIVCDFEQARDALLALRGLGARAVLDDFGTGHSSLSHVRLLPIDKLKIDASFVSDITSHRASEDIVKTVLELCRNMRLGCVVEGVEDSAQLEKVRELGASLVQGYYFSRPMPEADVPNYLAAEARAALGWETDDGCRSEPATRRAAG